MPFHFVFPPSVTYQQPLGLEPSLLQPAECQVKTMARPARQITGTLIKSDDKGLAARQNPRAFASLLLTAWLLSGKYTAYTAGRANEQKDAYGEHCMARGMSGFTCFSAVPSKIDRLSGRLCKALAAAVFSAVPVLCQGLNTDITLTADDTIAPTASEVVTFGLPLARGEVLDSKEIRVLQGSTELKVNVQDGLRWHWLDNSLRSVTIQLQGVDMTSGDLTLTVTDAGRNVAQDLAAVAHSRGWASAGPLKANLPFPRILALHDPVYLESSGIIPPYVSGSVSAGVGKLQSEQFDTNYGAMEYTNSSGASWLFDRATAMLKAYMMTGDVKFLKEGFLSKQFYFTHVRNDGSRPYSEGGSGCWDYATIECADGKFIYTEPAKLAWALFGDNSQWDNELINKMALQADLGSWQHATRDPFSEELEGFTERSAGIAGLTDVGAYEITGDATILAHINERIESLRDMQQEPKAWDIANGWLPMSGAFTHSWARHEGWELPPEGTADDRRFSPWMSENIADFLWHAYHVTSDAQLAATIGEMLRQLGNAIDLYGFMSLYEAGEGVRATYTRKPGLSGSYNSCGAPDGLAVELMYSGSAYASPAALTKTQMGEGGFVDQHNVEVILPLALAFHFESDAVAKQRLLARIEHMKRQWTNNPAKSCARIFSSQVYRLFNWQHRSNSVGTWEWVRQSAGVELQPDVLTLSYSGYIFASTGECADGENWHWQCQGQWVEADSYAAQKVVATCNETDGRNCANEGNNKRWTAVSLLTESSQVLTCATLPANPTVAHTCPSLQFLQSGDTIASAPAAETAAPVARPAAIAVAAASAPAAAAVTGANAGAAVAAAMLNLSYPGYIFASTTECVDGYSWHWQCKGQWVEAGSYAAQQFIATCDNTDGISCDNIVNNKRWTAVSALTGMTHVLICGIQPRDLTSVHACKGARFIQSE
jgi:hypothetical protein